MNRRDFLCASAASLALAAGGRATADPKPRVVVIGCGWFGMFNLQNLLDVASVEVVGLADPDSKMLESAGKWCVERGQKPPRMVKQYKELLADKPDIAIIGTPDHWHALPTIDAVAAGADVYVEKPVSVDVAEGQAMVEAARRHNRVVQVGMQRRSTPHIVRAKEFIASGGAGRIARVQAYCYYHMGGSNLPKDNPPDADPPAHLDYDLWTGPAPMRPYNPLVHPKTWRRFTEYGNGIIGDMGVHMLDAARFILGLGHPRRIDANAGILVHKQGKANISDTMQATFDYGDTIMTWEHRTWGNSEKRHGWGVDFLGEKGTVRLNVDFWEYWPNFADQPAQRDEAVRVDKANEHDSKIITANRAHMRDFLACIAERGSRRPVADIEEGATSTGMCVLANMSAKLGRSIRWDGTTCVGDAEASGQLVRPYRTGYTHPAAAGRAVK
ncbi:MAG: Gfo/Idh/MocA family oxidoreductase [Gemmataceae bacterium]|nr:Gfo/Idh/MocA family oxidoreductase [Gemmataceae bacterium]